MKRTYELLMIIMSIVAVSTIWHHTPYNSTIIWIVWGIFFIDFLFQFSKSGNKVDFIKNNPFLILAIIPFDAIFQFARFARIIHLFRLKTITKYFAMPVVEKFKQKSKYGITAIMMLFLVASSSLYFFEPTVTSINDAFLYGFLAVIIFGHADITTVSIVGQTIIISITLLGVLLHGIVLGFIFDFLKNRTSSLASTSQK